MFDGISVTCFAASYLVVMILDFTRFYFRATVRNILVIGFAIAGWMAHLSYLVYQVGSQWQSGVPVSSWESWCWIISLILVSVYFYFLAKHPKANTGMYLMPVALVVIVAGIFAKQLEPFSQTDARGVWHNIHGIALLIGLIAVLLGFVAGLMYLVQSNRLKHHSANVGRVKTLSLESLHRIGERALIASTIFLAIGLISGVVEHHQTTQWPGCHWVERSGDFDLCRLVGLVNRCFLFRCPLSTGPTRKKNCLPGIGKFCISRHRNLDCYLVWPWTRA